MKDKPKIVTPTASTIGTPNPFAALAETPETPESDVGSVEESVVDIPDDEYLPNLPNQTATEASAITSTTVVIPTATTTTATDTSTNTRAQPSIALPSDPIQLKKIPTTTTSA